MAMPSSQIMFWTGALHKCVHIYIHIYVHIYTHLYICVSVCVHLFMCEKLFSKKLILKLGIGIASSFLFRMALIAVLENSSSYEYGYSREVCQKVMRCGEGLDQDGSRRIHMSTRSLACFHVYTCMKTC